MSKIKKLFLVLGPESSGNHLTSLVLQKMGCYWEEPQKLDSFLEGTMELKDITDEKNIVLRRSVPHGREWPSPVEIEKRFKEEGYTMGTIILQREWMATCLSNYYHRSNTVEEAEATLRDAEKHIARYLYNSALDPFYVLNVSSMMKDPVPSIKGLERFTGLKWPSILPVDSVVRDSDIGRHNLLLEHGFKSIDRMIHKKYIRRHIPLVVRSCA